MNSPVLFLTFNRPHQTLQVFHCIRNARPPRLYIASDGPRDNKDGDAEKVNETRQMVLDAVDWNCEVKTLFRDKNLGCKNAVSSAISWFFENEEMGIILEDDCLPSQTFFLFCEELLQKYKDDTRVFGISGDNFLDGPVNNEFSYQFTKYFFCWGWASWRRAWNYYNSDFDLWNKCFNQDYYGSVFFNKSEERTILSTIDKITKNELNTWDWQFYCSAAIQHGLFVFPSVNMVTNIGSGSDSTHVNPIKIHNNLPMSETVFPLLHPPFLLENHKVDSFFQKKFYQQRNLYTKLKRYFFRYIK